MPKYYSHDGNIEVWKEKPQGYYTVEEWQELHPAPAPPELTIDEKLVKLDSQYNSEVTRLGNEYTSATLRNDSDTQQELTQEMLELDEWYDTEYNNIIGGDE